MTGDPGQHGEASAQRQGDAAQVHVSTLAPNGANGGQPASNSALRWVLVIVPLLLVVLGSTYLASVWIAQRQAESVERAKDRAKQAERRPPGSERRPADREAVDGTPTPARTGDFDVAVVMRLLPRASAQDGASVFKICAVCHTDEKNGPHKVGSNLWNIVGSAKATRPDYRYSQALRAKGGTWSYRELADYLHNPRTSVPGTSMAFAGITGNARMANLLAYLRTLSDRPAPLPN